MSTFMPRRTSSPSITATARPSSNSRLSTALAMVVFPVPVKPRKKNGSRLRSKSSRSLLLANNRYLLSTRCLGRFRLLPCCDLRTSCNIAIGNHPAPTVILETRSINKKRAGGFVPSIGIEEPRLIDRYRTATNLIELKIGRWRSM